jgi:hypothetical protein
MIHMKHDLLSVSGQEVSLVLRPNLSHNYELLRICTTWHLHLKVLLFLLYNDDMVPFWPLFGPYNYL